MQIVESVREVNAEKWSDRYGDEPRKGCDILVQALEREGVDTVFAYPGGASMEIHQALTRSPLIRNILCRHEQVRRRRRHRRCRRCSWGGSCAQCVCQAPLRMCSCRER